MSAKKDCPLCGTKLPIDAMECSTCGEMFDGNRSPPSIASEHPAEIECPSCMSLVPAGAEDCPICGDKLPSAIPEAPAIETGNASPVAAEAPTATIVAPDVPATKECPECGTLSDALAIECPTCGFKYEYEGLTLPIRQAPPEPAPLPAPEAPAKREKGKQKGKQKPAPPKVEEPVKQKAPEIKAPVTPPPAEMAEMTVRCPACGENVKSGSELCPLCGVTISDYVIKCPGCGASVPAIDEVCPECFTTLKESGTPSEQNISPAIVPVSIDIDVSGTPASEIMDAPEGRECLVCGALLEEIAENCPICKQPFGTTLPPEEIVDQHWEGVGIEIPKDYFKCPNCESVLTDTDPTDCEANERKWFYRAIIALFSGIFLSSASIWVRGVTVESQAQGLSPMPMDAIVNIGGWILVIIGAIFWIFSWKAAESAKLCPSCGCEVQKEAKDCPECGECFDLLEDQGLNGLEPKLEEEA
jgi:hypothetical protein